MPVTSTVLVDQFRNSEGDGEEDAGACKGHEKAVCC